MQSAPSTAEAVTVDTFPAWRDAVQGLFPGFDPRGGEPRDFHASYLRRTVGDLRLTEMSAARYTIVHDRFDHRAAARPGCCLILQVEGEGVVAQAGREVALSPGDLTLVDGTRPARLAFDRPHRQLAVQLPYRTVAGQIGSDMPSARLMAGPGVPLMRDMIATIFRGADLLPARHGVAYTETLVDLVALALGRAAAADARARLPRIKRYIDDNLADPSLSPQAIARANAVSLRQLHRLFAAGGVAVGEWILERRLERCRADLADPRLAHEPIGVIALRWGFNGFSHFSRCFRRRYGLAPRDWRGRAG